MSYDCLTNSFGGDGGVLGGCVFVETEQRTGGRGLEDLL